MIIGICDDNELYLKSIHKKVEQILPDNRNIEIISVTPSKLHANIQNVICSYDILITDIDMGDLNGIDLAKKINNINPNCIIIFISNFINYATSVYDVEHLYFVLKSEADSSLPKALSKALNVYNSNQNSYLNFNYSNTDYRIALADISHVESLGRYIHIHSSGTCYKCIHSLKNISTKFSLSFVQCHKSYLVNLNYVHSINRTECILTNGTTIPISYTYSKLFHKAFVTFISNKMK